MRANRLATTALIAAVSLVAAACGSNGATPRASTTTTTESTTTTAAPATTTTAAPVEDTTTTTAVPDTTTTTQASETLAYPVSTDYRVETVAVIDGVGAGGIAVTDERIFVADFGVGEEPGNSIYEVGFDGWVRLFTTVEGMDRGASMTIVGSTLYVSSFLTSEVYAVDDDGTAVVHTDVVGEPAGLATDGGSTLYIGDCNGDRIYSSLVSRDPRLDVRDDIFSCPTGVTVDEDDNIYVVGFNTRALVMVDPDDEITLLHRFPTENADVLYFNGQLFITSRVDHVVYRYDLATDTVDIIAGTGTAGSDDGPGREATLDRPNALALGPDGTIYVTHGSGNLNHPTIIRALIRQAP